MISQTFPSQIQTRATCTAAEVTENTRGHQELKYGHAATLPISLVISIVHQLCTVTSEMVRTTLKGPNSPSCAIALRLHMVLGSFFFFFCKMLTRGCLVLCLRLHCHVSILRKVNEVSRMKRTDLVKELGLATSTCMVSKSAA